MLNALPVYPLNVKRVMMRTSLLVCCFLIFLSCSRQESDSSGKLEIATIPGATPRNVIFILTDDHRFDFMGFTGKVPWLKTPNMDRMAREGSWFRNTYVTTALCSPSRASILTGLYSHTHTVVDNIAPDPKNLTFFPQYLQAGGYETAFFGKWHMGEADDKPRPGFDHWESFKGQGVYYNPTLNINGEQVKYGDSTYITDLLTEHALDWLEKRSDDKPFFLYLSHKAVHSEFSPAQRHRGTYANAEIVYPPSYNTSAQPVKGKLSDNKSFSPRSKPESETVTR